MRSIFVVFEIKLTMPVDLLKFETYLLFLLHESLKT